MAETGQSADKTINLTHVFLGASDHKNLIAEGTLRVPSTASSGTEFTETGNAHELRSQALAANTAPDKDTSIVLSASQQAKRDVATIQTKKREEQHRMQLTLAEQARQLSERLAQQIADMEAAFEAKLGDAWREQIANKMMEPDDIPQRREGESMQDYRDRLETVLIATMIDENGQIKPEYANSDDPDTQRYAEWARAQHAQNGLNNASPDELERNVENARDVSTMLENKRVQQSQDVGSAETDRTVDAQRNSASDFRTKETTFIL